MNTTVDIDVKPYVYFVTNHPGPAKQFATLAESLKEKSIPFGVLCGKNVIKPFDSKMIPHQTFDEEADTETLSQLVLKVAANASYVITDISNEKWSEVHSTLASKAENVRRVVYYDNPENCVPGGYSETAAKVIPYAQTILFSNHRFESDSIYKSPGDEIDLTAQERFGLGLYLRDEAAAITKLRLEEGPKLRQQLFEQIGVKDEGQKIITYIGGANAVYYEEAFPAFLEILQFLYLNQSPLLKNVIFLLQQHPRASKEGDQDFNQIKKLQQQEKLPGDCKWIVPSKFNTFQGLAIADVAVYYQTSMAAQFPFAGIPTIQVGHEKFEDCLTENGFPSVKDSEGFQIEVEKLFKNTESAISQEQIENLEASLGIRADWKERWFQFLKL